jgi:hypothetical protein
MNEWKSNLRTSVKSLRVIAYLKRDSIGFYKGGS